MIVFNVVNINSVYIYSNEREKESLSCVQIYIRFYLKLHMITTDIQVAVCILLVVYQWNILKSVCSIGILQVKYKRPLVFRCFHA